MLYEVLYYILLLYVRMTCSYAHNKSITIIPICVRIRRSIFFKYFSLLACEFTLPFQQLIQSYHIDQMTSGSTTGIRRDCRTCFASVTLPCTVADCRPAAYSSNGTIVLQLYSTRGERARLQRR